MGRLWGTPEKDFDKVVCYFINDKGTRFHRHGITDVKTNLGPLRMLKRVS